MKRIRLFTFCFAFAIFLCVRNTTVNSQETVFDTSPQSSKTYNLSLGEATRLALVNNFEIQLAQFDAQMALANEGVAQSIYDTIFDAEVKYRNNQRAQSSNLLGGKTLDNDYNIGLKKKLPSGTTLEVNMTNNREWSDSSFVTLNPSHDSTLEVTLKQELGKNFFGLQDRGDVKITRLDIENSQHLSLDRIEQTVSDVQKAYWDLVLAIELRELEEGMVVQAKKLYDLHQEKIRDGLVENPDLYASEANYKNRLNELELAKNNVASQNNTLKLLLNIPEEHIQIAPSASFDFSRTDERFDDSLEVAFKNRRDYKRVMNEVKSKDIQLSMKRNNLWPEINVEASFARNGIGDHFKQAVTKITDEDNPEFFLGLSLSIPLENTKARSEVQQTELDNARTLLDLKYVERKISVGIIDQVRNSNIFKEIARNDVEIVDLQQKKLDEEQKRFSVGRSNTDTIIRFQEDLLGAQRKAAESLRRYHTSTVDLRLLEGALLNQYWEDAEIETNDE